MGLARIDLPERASDPEAGLNLGMSRHAIRLPRGPCSHGIITSQGWMWKAVEKVGRFARAGQLPWRGAFAERRGGPAHGNSHPGRSAWVGTRRGQLSRSSLENARAEAE
jgi:hypothetical protein